MIKLVTDRIFDIFKNFCYNIYIKLRNNYYIKNKRRADRYFLYNTSPTERSKIRVSEVSAGSGAGYTPINSSKKIFT